jgi:hypothetical protein
MRDKGFATAVATLLAAFATAHLMQFGLSAGRLVSGNEQAAPIGLATLVARGGEVGAAGAREGLGRPAPDEAPRDAGVAAAPGSPDDGAEGSCDRSLEVTPEPGILLRLQLHAPCDPGVRVEIRHAGLRFALATAEDGTLDAVFPAMAAESAVMAVFADGTVLRTWISLPDARRVERVALVSEAAASLALHAFEFGALRGAAGHVHARADRPRPGAFHSLGDPTVEAPVIAEVYTFPAGRFGSVDGVRLGVEAEITAANCARDVRADLVGSHGGARSGRTGLHLAMPACKDAGDVLVIDLPMPDVRLARN